jgi:hypothetical protein
MNTPILDWEPRFDPKSKEYPIRATLRLAPKRNKLWRVGPIMDQGNEGACVGFGWAAEAFSTPVPVSLSRMKTLVPQESNSFAKSVYVEAQKIDEWEGENYSGTSVLAGAKTMQSLRLLKEYRWAFSIDDVVDSVLSKGPVVLGIEWREGMYDAPNGVLTSFGAVVGGHCITAVGYRYKSEKLGGEDGIVLQNSWGIDWGINGLAVIKVSELAALLAKNGEACVPSKRSFGR